MVVNFLVIAPKKDLAYHIINRRSCHGEGSAMRQSAVLFYSGSRIYEGQGGA
jgi:hypothetical protein